MKAVKQALQDSNPERVEAFEKGAQAFAKKVVTNFKDYEFVCVDTDVLDGVLTKSLVHRRVDEP